MEIIAFLAIAGVAFLIAGSLWSNPTSTVPSTSTPFGDDKVYWPLDPSKTSDTIYGGEMLGMLYSTGFANHFDDSAPMLFLGTKEGITHRLQSDTPAGDFKEMIRKPRYIGIPLASGHASIPGSIGSPAYATDSGHVQLTTAALTNNNLAGMVVDIGRSQYSTAAASGILTLSGTATSVIIVPPDWGCLMGLVCQGFIGSDQTAAATVGGAAAALSVTGGRGGNTTGTGASTGGAGASLSLAAGAGGNAAAGTGNGGAGGSVTLNAGGGGTSSGGSGGAAGTVTIQSTTAPIAGGGTAAAILCTSTAKLGVYFGTGAPTFAAAKGSLYIKTDAGTSSTRLYIASDSAGTWTAFTSAA